MGKYFDDDGVIRNLPDPTPSAMEVKRRLLKDDARFTADKPPTRKQRDQLHEAHYECSKAQERGFRKRESGATREQKDRLRRVIDRDR